jgi:hypothetical protein
MIIKLMMEEEEEEKKMQSYYGFVVICYAFIYDQDRWEGL